MHLLLGCIALVQISIFTAKFSYRISHILMDVDTQCNADEEETSPTNKANSPSSEKRIVGDSGFHFTESGDFRDENGFAFQFDVSNDHSENQSRYEKIGEAVTECIYTIMETEYGLSRIPIPIGLDKSECSSFIFVSDDFMQSNKRKLVLINGSGAVKAGQWARSIIINDNLYPGSMFPYIEWAQSNDFDVLVMNTNESGPGMKKSENPFEHAETVWDEFLGALQSRNVHIVAHSFGGVIVQNLSKKKDNFKDIVHKIAFTDSVHMGRIASGSSINWVSSSKVANAYLGERLGCVIRSAGSTKHPWTSHYAMNHIFEWFMENENCAEFENNKTVQKSDKIVDESVSDSVSNDQ